jgi:hypothetical protein
MTKQVGCSWNEVTLTPDKRNGHFIGGLLAGALLECGVPFRFFGPV